MQVQINSDNHVEVTQDFAREIEAIVASTLERFGDRITRVEVHLSDESSSAKSVGDDKRCVLEARLAGLQPIAVTHQGATLEQALDGAAEKLEKTIDHTLGRLDDRTKGRVAPDVVEDEIV